LFNSSTKNTAKANLNIIKRYEFKVIAHQPLLSGYKMSSENRFPSVSRIDVKVIIKNKETLHGQLIRHLAPLTISEMLRSMPLHGAVHYNLDTFCYIQTHLNIGQEKSRKKFSKGDITLMTSNGAICFFLKDATVEYSMNYIGKVISNIEKLVSLKSVDELTITADVD
jgi:hypothetical protein